MGQSTIRGSAHVYGDNIDTDVIIAGKYTKTLDLGLLAKHVLGDLDPDFRHRVKPGDVLVAGENFGCGSSREQAPLALKAAGVSAVVAKSFARIFFRNAINIGLPALEVRHDNMNTGDELLIDLGAGIIRNLSKEISFRAKEMPQVMLHILEAGGLVRYLKKYGDYRLG